MIEFVNNLILIIKTNMPIYVFVVFFYVSMLAMSKRCTIPFMTILSSFLTIFCLYLSSTKIFLLILSLSLYFFSIWRYKKKTFNFGKRIFSLSLIVNLLQNKKEKGSKTIGRIVPYSEWQIKHNHKKINMSETAARGILMITGSSGSGKTYHLKELIKQDLDNGKPVVLFDFKGDYEIIEELKQYADMYDIPVYEMSPKLVNFNYDPLSNMNQAGKVETLLNTRKWSLDGSDSHYRTSTQLVIQKIVNEFDKVWENKENYLVGLYKFAKGYNCERSLYDGYTTFLKILEIILTSNIKSSWYGENDKDFSFELKGQYLAMFSFMSSNKELANSISSFVVKDLLDTGTKEAYEYGLPFYIDEAGTLENSFILKDLVEKGRSSKIETTLSLQDVNQIVINTNQAYLNSILGTINNFIIYGGTTKSTAELISGVQGGEIDKILMSLKKPIKGKPPTAMYISKYPYIEKERSVDVFKIVPYTRKNNILVLKNNNKNDSRYEENKMDEENIRTRSHDFYEENLNNENTKEETLIDQDFSVNYEDFL